MNLFKEIKNYQEAGAEATLSGLKAQEREIQECQHIVCVLAVISKLSSEIETAYFKSSGIKYLQIYPWEDEGKTKIALALLDKNNIKVEQKEQSIYFHILEIFDLIEKGEGFMNEEAFQSINPMKIIEPTLGGLSELKNYLLSPALQIKLEKAMLADAVKPLAATHENVAPVLKI